MFVGYHSARTALYSVLAVSAVSVDRAAVAPLATVGLPFRLRIAPVQTPTFEERFAKIIPEFAGAYRGPDNTLIVRVTDLELSRRGGQATVRKLLERDLAENGRSELKVTFESANYSYSRLTAWMHTLIDSLAAHHAGSWAIDERTGRIHVGVPDTSSRRGVLAAATKVGIPRDAIFAGIETIHFP